MEAPPVLQLPAWQVRDDDGVPAAEPPASPRVDSPRHPRNRRPLFPHLAQGPAARQPRGDRPRDASRPARRDRDSLSRGRRAPLVPRAPQVLGIAPSSPLKGLSLTPPSPT